LLSRLARLGIAALACFLAGCSGATAAPSTTGHPAASSSRSSTGLVVANGHGWTSAGLDGPIPAAGTCHLRYTASGEPLPDPACTPGAVDPTVTQASLSTTVCRKGGYTSSVRPPESITEPFKKQIMAAYGIPWAKASNYELDHLVELAIGGASDTRNLWPEPNTIKTATASQYVHNDKDQAEQTAFNELCSGKVKLAPIQNQMANDWTSI
jgi:hypothetical protein